MKETLFTDKKGGVRPPSLCFNSVDILYLINILSFVSCCVLTIFSLAAILSLISLMYGLEKLMYEKSMSVPCPQGMQIGADIENVRIIR